MFMTETLENPFGPDTPDRHNEFDDLMAGKMISSSILIDSVNQFAHLVQQALETQGLPGFHIFTTQESHVVLESVATESAVFAHFLLVSSLRLVYLYGDVFAQIHPRVCHPVIFLIAKPLHFVCAFFFPPQNLIVYYDSTAVQGANPLDFVVSPFTLFAN
jgi:hypothetical protein